jgi:predicted amidohydrolase
MSPGNPLVAALQMASGPHVEANLLEAERLLGLAAAQGARLAVLPEAFAFMGKSDPEQLKIAEEDGSGPIQSFLANMARRHGLWLVGGTLPIHADSPGKVRAACLVFDDRGERVGRYDKIHLFDADLPGSGERYRESAVFEPGDRPLWLDSPFGRIGLAVCYDLRFPELFRHLMCAEVDLFCLPAAFTALTGKAHWEVLLRARAVENQSFIVAAAQGGFHKSGRQTYGHSMIVDPWGKILAEAGTGPALVSAPVDAELLQSTRHNLPVLRHRRIDTPCPEGSSRP